MWKINYLLIQCDITNDLDLTGNLSVARSPLYCYSYCVRGVQRYSINWCTNLICIIKCSKTQKSIRVKSKLRDHCPAALSRWVLRIDKSEIRRKRWSIALALISINQVLLCCCLADSVACEASSSFGQVRICLALIPWSKLWWYCVAVFITNCHKKLLSSSYSHTLTLTFAPLKYNEMRKN